MARPATATPATCPCSRPTPWAHATIEYVSHEIKLAGPDGIMGRGVIVHRDPDDYKTQPTGSTPARLACGVVMTGS